MLKTVKVGNTSLQYTVVSQTDELSVGSNAVNVLPTSRKRKTRHRKTVILVLITMVMGCGIVIAAVLVPILIASKLVGSLPESAKFKTFAISADSIQGYGKHIQHGPKFVELLPIVDEAPVDASIEFQDQFPSASFSVDGKLFFSAEAASPTTYRSTEAPANLRLTIGNVTNYYGKAGKDVEVTQDASLSSSVLVTKIARISDNILNFLIKNALLLVTALAVLIAFVIIVSFMHCWKHKANRRKMDWKEDKAVRNQLLTAIPMTDD